MDSKGAYPSLPDLLRRTILTFCQGSVKFERHLEVIGSLHIRSDNNKVATFIIEEEVISSNPAQDVTQEKVDGASVVDAKVTQSGESTTGNTGLDSAFAVPKKSRKIQKPVRKMNYGIGQGMESSDGESEVDLTGLDEEQPPLVMDVLQNRTGQNPYENKVREYVDYTDSNASMSSDDIYRLSQHPISSSRSAIISDVSMTSPQAPIGWEVTSTRPDDMLPTSHPGSAESPIIEASPRSSHSETKPPHESDAKLVKMEERAIERQEHDLGSIDSRQMIASLTDEASPSRSLHDSVSYGDTTPLHMDTSPMLDSSPSMVPFSKVETVIQPSLDGLSGHYTASEIEMYGLACSDTLSSGAVDRHDGRFVSCPECGRMLKSDKMLELHMNTAHTHRILYPCKICGKIFYAASSLHSHKRRTHSSEDQKTQCPHCPRSFAFHSEYLRHIEISHVDEKRGIQNISTSDHSQPLEYQSLQEGGASVVTTTSQQVVPTTSSSATSSFSKRDVGSLQGTIVQDTNGEKYHCNVCGLLLKSKECLSLHINAKHTQKQQYPCHVCGKVFYAPSSRFCHVKRIHGSREQKFKCQFCDKIFTFHYELRNHIKMFHRNKRLQAIASGLGEQGDSNETSQPDSGGATDAS